MKNNPKSIPHLCDAISPALHEAFLKAAECAKQTQTYLVVERNGHIEYIPYEKIDAFIAEGKHG